MKPTTTLATIATVAALALAGCSAGTSSQNGGMDGGTSAGSAAYDSSKSQQSTVDTATTPTSVIRTGDMSLNTQDVSGTYDKVKAAVIAAGGRIESSSFYAGGSGTQPSAQVVARIPEAKLDATIDTLSALAKRTALNLSSSDVTLQRVDLEAKVKALTAARDRLQQLVSQATKVGDLIEAENALAQRQAERAGHVLRQQDHAFVLEERAPAGAPDDERGVHGTGLEMGIGDGAENRPHVVEALARDPPGHGVDHGLVEHVERGGRSNRAASLQRGVGRDARASRMELAVRDVRGRVRAVGGDVVGVGCDEADCGGVMWVRAK